MKRIAIVCFILNLLLLVSCHEQKGESLSIVSMFEQSFTSFVEEPAINEEYFRKIIENYDVAVSQDVVITRGQKVKYDEIFAYFFYHGIFSGYEVNSEILNYFDVTKYYGDDDYVAYIPAEIVDTFLLSKFDTEVDHDLIDNYDCETNSYMFSGGEGVDYYYKADFLYYHEIENGIFEILAIIKPDTGSQEDDDADYWSKKKFIIAVKNGDYKFLAVEPW